MSEGSVPYSPSINADESYNMGQFQKSVRIAKQNLIYITNILFKK